MKKPIVVLAVMGILLLFTTMIFAASESNSVNQDSFVAEVLPPLPVADMKIGATEIRWTPHVENAGLVLTVSGPDNLYFRQEFANGVELALGLLDGAGVALPDGSYNYELYTIPVLSREAERAVSDGREGDVAGVMAETRPPVSTAIEAVTQSGHFRVDGGTFVLPMAAESVTASRDTSAVNTVSGVRAPDDQVILDDLIVDGSACIGQDCVNGESFGFDTLRLKENNLRIRAIDTSSTSSFPSRDWQITFNDSSNGGLNKFSIDDIDGGRTPFTLEAGAPSHSLYVDDGGRLGLGTSTPVVQAHMVDGNTPTLRLEQDGSSGFTPQTWDVAGNEANFFVRDATNGSTLPFRIFPGAPSNSLNIEASSGDIGLGTTSPEAALEIEDSNGNAQILVDENNGTVAARTLLTLDNNGSPELKLLDSSTGNSWSLGVDAGGFYIKNGATNFFRLGVTGNADIYGTFNSGGNPAIMQPKIGVVSPEQQIQDLEARLAELEALVEALMAESN